MLARKIQRRCEARDLTPPPDDEVRRLIDGVVARLTRAGLLDDRVYARGRARTLAAKGLPGWRIQADLRREGVAAAQDIEAAGSPVDDTEQARRFAERKRIGPFRQGRREAFRDKDLSALVRAGFSLAVAREIIGNAALDHVDDA